MPLCNQCQSQFESTRVTARYCSPKCRVYANRIKNQHHRGQRKQSINKSLLTQRSTIYFIQAGLNGPIKIGVTTNLKQRIKDLQTSNPEKLYLIAAIYEHPELELYLHKQFKKYHIRGEWFEPGPDIFGYLLIIKNGTEDTNLTYLTDEAYIKNKGIDKQKWFEIWHDACSRETL